MTQEENVAQEAENVDVSGILGDNGDIFEIAQKALEEIMNLINQLFGKEQPSKESNQSYEQNESEQAVEDVAQDPANEVQINMDNNQKMLMSIATIKKDGVELSNDEAEKYINDKLNAIYEQYPELGNSLTDPEPMLKKLLEEVTKDGNMEIQSNPGKYANYKNIIQDSADTMHELGIENPDDNLDEFKKELGNRLEERVNAANDGIRGPLNENERKELDAVIDKAFTENGDSEKAITDVHLELYNKDWWAMPAVDKEQGKSVEQDDSRTPSSKLSQDSQIEEQVLTDKEKEKIIASMAKDVASEHNLIENGNELSHKESERVLTNMFKASLKEHDWNLADKNDRYKMFYDVRDTISNENSSLDIKFDAIRGINKDFINYDVETAIKQFGTEDRDLLNRQIANNISDSLDIPEEYRDDIEKMVKKSYSESGKDYNKDFISNLNNRVSDKQREWQPEKERFEEVSLNRNENVKTDKSDKSKNDSMQNPTSVDQLTYEAGKEVNRRIDRDEKSVGVQKNNSLGRE